MAKELKGAALRSKAGGPRNYNDMYHYAGGEARSVKGVDQTNGRTFRSSKKEVYSSINGAGDNR